MSDAVCRRCGHFKSIHTLGFMKGCTAPGCPCKLKVKT
jgi:hypothetical protein